MTGRLVYVVGPSGAGKDSVLLGLREAWAGMPAAHWARRTITRHAQPAGEAHESVSDGDFLRLRAQQAFALHWQAHGLHYGVRATELQPLERGICVFVNGSRGYLPCFVARYPHASIVQITASIGILQQRLESRGRESAAAISERLRRAVVPAFPADTLHIQNDGSLQDAVQALRAGLLARL